MYRTITVDDKEYELQITVRRVINGGMTSVSMGNNEAEELMEEIEDDLMSAIEAIDYAVEQRECEASYESDDETRRTMEADADEWAILSERLSDLL